MLSSTATSITVIDTSYQNTRHCNTLTAWPTPTVVLLPRLILISDLVFRQPLAAKPLTDSHGSMASPVELVGAIDKHRVNEQLVVPLGLVRLRWRMLLCAAPVLAGVVGRGGALLHGTATTPCKKWQCYGCAVSVRGVFVH